MKSLLTAQFCLCIVYVSAAYLQVIKPTDRGQLREVNVVPADDSLRSVDVTEEVDYITLPDEDFVKEKVKRRGSYRELIVSLSGVIALQRVAGNEQQSLTLLEITNGTLIVQLIFGAEDQLIDCDATNTRHEIHQLTKHINSKLTQPDFNVSEEITPNLNISVWIAKCTELHENQLEQKLVNQTISVQYAGETNPNERSKRAISDLIYPGTKWCGKGNTARSYFDLGEQRDTDKCCRRHDLCNDVIPSLSYKYNYFNYGLLTISSCECDESFKMCLQKAKYWESDSIADMIGHLYFNVIGMSCFKIQPRRVCKQSSWWGRCTRYGHEMSAIFEVSSF